MSWILVCSMKSKGNFINSYFRMKYSLLIIVFTLISCNSSTEERLPSNDSAKSVVAVAVEKSVRFFPDIKSTVTFDTTINDGQLQIIITKTDRDSYVAREYEQQIDRYRDAEVALTVKQKGQILLDTTFRKEQFSKYADTGLIDVAIFHNYWFKNIDKNKIEFFGTICEPETDWALDFNHLFDLTNKRLEFVVRKDDQE